MSEKSFEHITHNFMIYSPYYSHIWNPMHSKSNLSTECSFILRIQCSWMAYNWIMLILILSSRDLSSLLHNCHNFHREYIVLGNPVVGCFNTILTRHFDWFWNFIVFCQYVIVSVSLYGTVTKILFDKSRLWCTSHNNVN